MYKYNPRGDYEYLYISLGLNERASKVKTIDALSYAMFLISHGDLKT